MRVDPLPTLGGTEPLALRREQDQEPVPDHHEPDEDAGQARRFARPPLGLIFTIDKTVTATPSTASA